MTIFDVHYRENVNVNGNDYGYTYNDYGYESKSGYANNGFYGDRRERGERNGENLKENTNKYKINDKGENAFLESYNKRAKISKKIILTVFSILGFIFVVLGIIFGKTVERTLYVFCAVGGFYLIFGIIIYYVVPNKIDYDKVKRRVNKYGYNNFYLLSAKIEEFSVKIEELETANQNLSEKVNELEKIVENLRK